MGRNAPKRSWWLRSSVFRRSSRRCESTRTRREPAERPQPRRCPSSTRPRSDAGREQVGPRRCVPHTGRRRVATQSDIEPARPRDDPHHSGEQQPRHRAGPVGTVDLPGCGPPQPASAPTRNLWNHVHSTRSLRMATNQIAVLGRHQASALRAIKLDASWRPLETGPNNVVGHHRHRPGEPDPEIRTGTEVEAPTAVGDLAWVYCTSGQDSGWEPPPGTVAWTTSSFCRSSSAGL